MILIIMGIVVRMREEIAKVGTSSIFEGLCLYERLSYLDSHDSM